MDSVLSDLDSKADALEKEYKGIRQELATAKEELAVAEEDLCHEENTCIAAEHEESRMVARVQSCRRTHEMPRGFGRVFINESRSSPSTTPREGTNDLRSGARGDSPGRGGPGHFRGHPDSCSPGRRASRLEAVAEARLEVHEMQQAISDVQTEVRALMGM